MVQVSLEVCSSLSSDVIFALAVFISRLSSSFSMASFETGTEFFFCFLDGGALAGTIDDSCPPLARTDGAG